MQKPAIALLLAATAMAAADPWPPAVAPATQPLTAHLAIDRTTYIPNFQNPAERHFQKSHLEGEIHVGPQGFWTRTTQKEMPWDDVQVFRKGEKPTQFQIDSKAEMTIEPVGLFRTEGSTTFAIGEPFGWTDLNLNGVPPKRTLEETLRPFKIESKENGLYRGKNSKGIEVEIATDEAGARLRRLEFRDIQKGFQLTRRTEYTAWQKIGDRYIPTAGLCSLRVDYLADGVRESDIAAFKLTNLHAEPTPAKPPFQEGMLFRELTTSGPPKAFRYEKGKYLPTKDPGNVFIPGRLKVHDPSPIAPILVAMAATGAVALYIRRRAQSGTEKNA